MTAHPGDQDPASAIDGEAPPRTPSRRRPADTFAVRLLLSRHLNEMTISQAAAAAGLNDATWATWESGRRPRDIIDVCTKIANALDIDFDWLLLGGPLAGPRGVPAKRTGGDTRRYPARADQMMSTGLNDRPQKGFLSGPHRRAVRVELPAVA